MSCIHEYIVDYRSGSNVCCLCGNVSNDLVYYSSNVSPHYNEEEKNYCPYWIELLDVISKYLYNFLKLDDCSFDYSKYYHTIFELWPKSNSRPDVHKLAAILCYHSQKNNTFVSMWDFAQYSGCLKKELYSLYEKFFDKFVVKNKNEKSDSFCRADTKLCFLTELYCIQLGITSFKIQKKIHDVAISLYQSYNFTSPFRAITATAIYIYCSTMSEDLVLKKTIKITQVVLVSKSSKSCIKRLRKKYIEEQKKVLIRSPPRRHS